MKKAISPIVDRDTGNVHLARGVIGAGTSLSKFVKLTDAARDGDDGTYRLPSELLGKATYLVMARFSKRALAQLTLINNDPKYGTSWEDTSQKKQLALRAAHDRVLNRDLGPAHERDDAHYYAEWTFPWGKVESSFTPTDFNTAIEIRYLTEKA